MHGGRPGDARHASHEACHCSTAGAVGGQLLEEDLAHVAQVAGRGHEQELVAALLRRGHRVPAKGSG